LIKSFLAIFVFMFTIAFAQKTDDSTRTLSPKKAALWAFIPGGGQFYNKKILKAGLIFGAEIAAFYFWQDNASNYKNYDDPGSNFDLPKGRYLSKRNKYGWWVGFIYFYGMLDAVVDAHLINFNKVMDQDIDMVDPETEIEIEEEQNGA